MLITFKSKSSPTVMMYLEHAQRIMDLWKKSPTRGVITAAEAPQALALLEQEVALSKLHPEVDAEHAAHSHPHDLPDDGEDVALADKQKVAFAQRAFPLLEMLRAAKTEGEDIIWGV
ncbi:DUF1840 domain-containing protein [Massilia sp. NR 4-1]|uniref:DUF1840 domain-containing protein n=1 Tax=Massilia sp. NR 4-1 TaxID=1678028 RepID=UPI00067AB43C|nr:DUF1840 domain-containing protein [Massilia sp. NR 4-1]AKU22617.1 hypothetical protein ACZ75_15150 [Massilia sp. NR 4-1]